MPRISSRVQMVDAKGFITREWYRFFFENTNNISLLESDTLTLPSTPEHEPVDDYSDSRQEIDFSPLLDEIYSQPVSDVASLQMSVDALQPQPPVTKTADFTVSDSDRWLINNKAGAACTVTMPDASQFVGRVLSLQNYQAQLLNSASSNVVPLTGGAAGTSILAATAGKWATLVSDGTNWVITQSN